MASRSERKAKLDAMSDDELVKFINRFGGGVLQNPASWSHQQWRDENITRLLNDGDGEHGDAIDRNLGLLTEYERRRQREEVQTDAARRSADSAERSERHAGSSKNAAWVSALAAAIAVVISVVALAKGCASDKPKPE